MIYTKTRRYTALSISYEDVSETCWRALTEPCPSAPSAPRCPWHFAFEQPLLSRKAATV